MGILDDIGLFRGQPGEGGNPWTFVELLGGKSVEITAFEPDPNTFRNDYYYNSRRNTLYKKLETPATGCSDTVQFVWKAVSEHV